MEFERPEVQQEKTDPVTEVFKLVHGRKPNPGEDIIETAFKIIEVLDSPNCVPRDLAREAVHQIIQMRDLKNPERDSRAIVLIKTVESEIIQNLYPELSKIDEIHWDDEEKVYRRWKYNEENES